MRSRDLVFELILKTAKSQVSMSSFPSTELLEVLMKMGIAKRLETDAWIHPHSFRSECTRPELLTALIAAGCVCIGVKAISRTGLVLFEIVRQALVRALEEDNSVVRDLQYLQASMIWLDVCAFCGFKRKMEIAESNLLPLVTAVRRSGKFDTTDYDTLTPLPSDNDETLDAKWRRWIEMQSYSRLVHHLFEHDMLLMLTKHRNPLISYAELSLPLPVDRRLWLASTADVWRAVHNETTPEKMQSSLSLRDLLANGDLLRCLPDHMDKRLATTAYLYGMSGQCWEHYQQSLIHDGRSTVSDPSVSLWMQSRQQHLYLSLQGVASTVPECWPTTKLLAEFLLASLHANFSDVERFLGHSGEEQAHRAYQQLQPWSQSRTARIAVWHAAQGIRWARATAAYQLRGCDSFMTCRLVLILWTYSMMQCDAARRTARSSPSSGAAQLGPKNAASANGTTLVFLDGPRDNSVDAFLQFNTGRPCLRLRQEMQDGSVGQIADLRNPQSMMTVGVETLESNCPNEARSEMPQMIRTLCELMSELGNLR
jgi:hypothetical protein